MAKIIKFPLKMADGFGARTLEELREHADVSSIAAYYDNGKLHRWLLANYLDDNAKEIDSIKESLKTEYNKIDTQKIQKIYESLGISKIDEQQLSDFLENGVNEIPTSENDFNIQNDPALKNEVIKHIHSETKIDDWDIACSDADDSNLTQVYLDKKNEDIFLSFKLNKDSSFFIKIANMICNLSNTLLSDDIKDLKQDCRIKEEIEVIFQHRDSSPILFGNSSWQIIKKNAYNALLLSAKPIAQLTFNKVIPFIESNFLSNNFSPEEKSCLVSLNETSIKLLATQHNYESVYGSTNQKIFLLAGSDVNELFSLQEKRHENNWWLIDGYVKGSGGVEKFGMKQLDDKEFDVFPAIIVSRYCLE